MNKIRSKVTITLPPVEQKNINFDALQNDIICLSDSECKGNSGRKLNTIYYNKLKNSFHIYGASVDEVYSMLAMACDFSCNINTSDDYNVVSFNSKDYFESNIIEVIKNINGTYLIEHSDNQKTSNSNVSHVVFKLTQAEKSSDDEHASMYAECVDSFFSIDSSLITNKYKSFKLWLKPFMSGVYDTLLSVSETFISFSNKAFFFYVQVFFADGDSKVSNTKLEFLKDNIAQIFFMVILSFVFGTILGLIAMH